jgi:protease-4
MLTVNGNVNGKRSMITMHRKLFPLLLLLAALSALVAVTGCATPRSILEPESVPLKEFTLQGSGRDKILIIHVEGFLSDERQQAFFRSKPSMVQEIVSQLKKAEADDQVKALILKVNSPGGTVTASDILYHEIASFKENSEVKIVVAMMQAATSGAYYISLPADSIIAHPTTITGSVGVLFIHPTIEGLMDKIGVSVDVSKSGVKKDMGSPLRQFTADEKKIIQELTDKLGLRFTDLVNKHRKLTREQAADVATARIYLADEALRLGLVDKIGYVTDAVHEAKNIAGLPQNAKVVVYRRMKYPDDNFYNTVTTKGSGGGWSFINVEFPPSMAGLQSGFYYLWEPGLSPE